MSTEEAVIAIDVATSGARATVFDIEGNRLVEVRRRYGIITPRPGWAEQDAREWTTAALSVLRGSIEQVVRRVRIVAIGLTGQCPTVVPVDGAGRPVDHGLLYRDNRAYVEALELRNEIGDKKIHELTGHTPAAFHIAPKVLWLRRHKPEVFARAARFLQPRDLVAFALTGQLATDGTHAASTLLFDLRRRCWDAGMFSRLDLDPLLFPPIFGSWEVIGELREPLVRRFGLPGSVPVVLGGADSQACAFGCGIVKPGPVAEMAGSSTCLNSVVDAPLADLAVTHYTHVVPGPFTTETGINTTGAAVEWLASLVYTGRRDRVRDEAYASLDADAAATPAGADGVLAIPVLGDGERNAPDVRAAFTGLSQRHGRGVLARAMLEGTAFAIRAQLDVLRDAGAPVTEIRISGGDTRLDAWNRIKADVTGLPVVVVPDDAASTGVAMLAGLGSGAYRDVDEALARCVRLGPRIEPDRSLGPLYDDRYSAYRTLLASQVVRRPD
jgi:sugar (pentulose or hexulose) kinase